MATHDATIGHSDHQGPAEKFFSQAVFHILRRRSRLERYLSALALTLLAVAIRLLIAPLDGGIQYVTFFPAVAIAALIGGFWPGMMTAMLGMTLATFLFWSPYARFVFAFQHQMTLSNAVFLIDALLVCSAIAAMHRFYQRFIDTDNELQLAASVFHCSSEGIMVTDAAGTLVMVNPAFSRITGYSAEAVIGQKPNILRSNHQGPEFYGLMWDALNGQGHWEGELWNRRQDGEVYFEWLTINRIDDKAGNPVRYVGVFQDITELRQKDERIEHLAFHDALTNLPNRVLIKDRLEHALTRAKRERKRFAVAFIDLDRFKSINDSLGHSIGDLLLQEVASRIRNRLRSMDTVGRMGGDEFVVLMEDVTQTEDCAGLAQSLLDEISKPMTLRNHLLQIGASIGIAIHPDDADTPEDLMKYADIAMYAAKSAGRNTYRFFRQTPE